MRFETSERIATAVEMPIIMAFAEEQLSKIASYVSRGHGGLTATSIEATFGSINRSDDTLLKLREVEGGYLLIAETHYRPSFIFWLFFLAALFTYVGWVIPIIIYFYQRGTVKAAIETFMKRIKHEFEALGEPMRPKGGDTISDLQALADLLAKGILSDDEFQREKERILAR